MKKSTEIIKNILITLAILCLCFLLCLVLKYIFNGSALISAIFVLGVYLVSILTPGYIYGISSALLSVLMVNFAFEFPLKADKLMRNSFPFPPNPNGCIFHKKILLQ